IELCMRLSPAQTICTRLMSGSGSDSGSVTGSGSNVGSEVSSGWEEAMGTGSVMGFSRTGRDSSAADGLGSTVTLLPPRAVSITERAAIRAISRTALFILDEYNILSI